MLYLLSKQAPTLLAQRQLGPILVYNQSAGPIYLGRSSAVSASSGSPLASGASIQLSAGQWWGIGTGSTQSLYVVPAASSLIMPPPVNPIPASAFGSGSDGPLVVDGPSTLTRDMQASSITITASGSLFTAGYTLYCTGIATVDGLLHANGGDAHISGGAAIAGQTNWGSQPSLHSGAAGVVANGGGTTATNAGISITSTLPAGGTVIAPGSGGQANASYSGSAGGAGVLAPAGWYPTSTNLASYVFAGGSSGGVISTQYQAASGAGGGTLLLYTQSLAGSGTISSQGGKGIVTGSEAYTAAGGSGGGIVLVLANDIQAWVGQKDVQGAPVAGPGYTGGSTGLAAIVTP